MWGVCFPGNFGLPVGRSQRGSVWTCRDFVKGGKELQALHGACPEPGRPDLMSHLLGLSEGLQGLGRRDWISGLLTMPSAE